MLPPIYIIGTESAEAAIGAYYAGDYFTMLDAQADLSSAAQLCDIVFNL